MVTWRLFGESHGDEVGIIVNGLSPFVFDYDKLNAFMARRKKNSPREERDEPMIEWNDASLKITIKNLNQRSEDYSEFATVPRPGHADYAAYLKDGKIPAGGGRWSGRMTAPLCAAGGIALQLLERHGVEISARVVSESANGREGDSNGALVEVVARGVPSGLGEAGAEGLESKLSAAFFSIPAVKGVEFGDGFQLANMHGSEANDAFAIREGKVVLVTNHCGGILGGISVGAPIVARLAFKPTPSIEIEQDSVDLKTLKEVKLKVHGRHDRCVAYRACPAVESVMALVVLGEMGEVG